MKLLKLSLITLLLSFTTTINAQDASNDATWEETVEFLKDFIPRFNGKTIHNPKKYKYSSEYYIKNDNLYEKFKEDDFAGENEYLINVKLDKLYSVELSKKYFVLKFIKNSVKKSGLTKNSVDYVSTMWINLQSNVVDGKTTEYNIKPNSENAKRLLKALKHLAYLAKQERKKSKF